jgi:hypothetical protein
MNIKVGDTVGYLGCTEEQVRWGNNDYPTCIVGRFYTVTSVDVRSQHTKIELKGMVGKFNSVCFEVVDRMFCDSNDNSEICKKHWNNFWEEDYEN